MTLMDIHVGRKNKKCIQNSDGKLLCKIKNKFMRLSFGTKCFIYIQGVTGGTDQTSGGCSLGHTIPI